MDYSTILKNVNFIEQSVPVKGCFRAEVEASRQHVSEDEQGGTSTSCCRICLLELDNNKNNKNTSMKLGCSCKGDMALAHIECVIKWFSIRGNKNCEVCDRLVSNLPPLLQHTKRQSCMTDWELDEQDMDDETDYYYPDVGVGFTRSWQGMVAELVSCLLAKIWFKVEELSEFP